MDKNSLRTILTEYAPFGEVDMGSICIEGLKRTSISKKLWSNLDFKALLLSKVIAQPNTSFCFISRILNDNELKELIKAAKDLDKYRDFVEKLNESLNENNISLARFVGYALLTCNIMVCLDENDKRDLGLTITSRFEEEFERFGKVPESNEYIHIIRTRSIKEWYDLAWEQTEKSEQLKKLLHGMPKTFEELIKEKYPKPKFKKYSKIFFKSATRLEVFL